MYQKRTWRPILEVRISTNVISRKWYKYNYVIFSCWLIPDFSRLVEGHLDHSTSSETVTSSQSGTCRDGVAVAGEPRHSHIHRLSATSSQHTPVNPTICNMQQPGSAVFKVSCLNRNP